MDDLRIIDEEILIPLYSFSDELFRYFSNSEFYNSIDTNNTYEFSIIKIKAGRDAQKPSLIFNRTINPKNIRAAWPAEEIIKIELNHNPTNKPNEPLISKTAVSAPNFTSPKRLNSLFICGFIK